MKALLQALRPFLACGVVLAVGLAGGAALLWGAKRSLASDLRALAAAKNERRTVQERLDRVAQDSRELQEHVSIWNRLNELHIIGEERRLEWLDALARIRAARGLHDLRYQIEPQKPWPGDSPKAPLEIRSSTMKVELALLHEGDLLQFLDDLRASGGAHYAVRKCSIHRAAPALRGKCEIELVTIAERKAGA